MSVSHLVRAALFGGTCLSVSFAAQADEGEPAIIVIGQQQRPIEIAPRGLSVSLGEEQFAAVNATNTEDLMKYAPNFFVRTRFPGDSNGVPGFRGTHSTQSARALVMVDGFTVSNFLGNSFGFAPKWGVVGPGEVRQLDIVYGPYSARYAGNSMGGIVNITTRDPEGTEAFARVQFLVQPYDQFGTKETYRGWSGEAGIGLRQKDGPWSLRLSGRHFRNDGHPQMFYGLVGSSATTGTAVTGAVVDPKQTVGGTPGAPGNPIFATQSPAAITQDQAKVKIGYDDGAITGQILLAYWHNQDRQAAPDCYLRDAAGAPRCDGAVSVGGKVYTAAGANFSRAVRDEYLLGGKIAVPFGDAWTARLLLSTYQIVRSDLFTSNGYAAGQSDGAGTLNASGPTGWYTGDLSVERRGGPLDIAIGLSGNLYRTDSMIANLGHWQSKALSTFASEAFGKTRTLSWWGEAVAHLSPAASITLGLRYDDWRAFDGGLRRAMAAARYAVRRADALSPTLSGQIDLPDGTRLQLSLAMATRFPTVGELFQGSLTNGQLDLTSFDPNLKPERSSDANILVSHRLGPVRLTGSAFYQRVSNTIFQFVGVNQSLFPTSNYKNIDLTRQYGFEGIVEARNWPVRGMTVEANAAWIDSRTLRNPANPAAEGVMFPRIPRWRINGTVRQAVGSRVDAALGLRYASRPNTDLLGLQRGDTYGFTSELFSLDAKVSWRATDALRFSAGVNNLTNDRAWVFHPYPQRNILIEAEWKL